MYLTSYFTSPNQPQLLAQLRACEWGAAKFLTELLEKEQFHHTLGAGDCYFLMAGDQIAAFATLTDCDCVDAPELHPWCGFVYTFPAYRHQRIAGKLLHELAKIARQNGQSCVISRPTTRMCTKNTAAPIWTAGVTLTAKSAESTH